MKRIKIIFSVFWFAFVSVISPAWMGLIYMNITGHGKGYAYDMGSEADIAVFFGIVELILWLIAFVPVMISLCKKGYEYKKLFVYIPFFVFLLLFGIGVFVIGWNQFIRLFGVGYLI